MSADFQAITSAAGIFVVAINLIVKLAEHCNPDWAIKRSLSKVAEAEKRKAYLKREREARRKTDEEFASRGSALHAQFGVAPTSRQIAARQTEAERA